VYWRCVVRRIPLIPTPSHASSHASSHAHTHTHREDEHDFDDACLHVHCVRSRNHILAHIPGFWTEAQLRNSGVWSWVEFGICSSNRSSLEHIWHGISRLSSLVFHMLSSFICPAVPSFHHLISSSHPNSTPVFRYAFSLSLLSAFPLSPLPPPSPLISSPSRTPIKHKRPCRIPRRQQSLLQIQRLHPTRPPYRRQLHQHIATLINRRAHGMEA